MNKGLKTQKCNHFKITKQKIRLEKKNFFLTYNRCKKFYNSKK